METAHKKVIQEYWTKNVPGLSVVYERYSPEQEEFYSEVDRYRYYYDPYIIPLIDSFAYKDQLILEIGCGMGTDTRYIAKKGANVISLDLSLNNVSFALKGIDLMGLRGKGICADAERLPFKSNTFDVVYSFGVLHHTPDTQKAIGEIYRVLKPKGKCVIMLYHKGYAYYVVLLMHGYKKLLRIYNQDCLMSKYDHTPLSRMYSKKEVNDLFKDFAHLDIYITTYGGIRAHPFLKYVYMLLQRSRLLMQSLGSFIIIKGKK